MDRGRHVFQRAVLRGHVARRHAWLILALVIILTGCDNPFVPSAPFVPTSHPIYLTRASAPGLQWLPALSRIPQSNGTKGCIIIGLTMFQRPGTATPQAIVSTCGGPYLLGEDGSDMHKLSMGADCSSAVLVSPDAQWISCDSRDYDGNSHVQLAALSADGASQARQAPLSSYSDLAWSPDGRYLAAYIDEGTQGYSNNPHSALWIDSPAGFWVG
jgi:hypothetical protein